MLRVAELLLEIAGSLNRGLIGFIDFADFLLILFLFHKIAGLLPVVHACCAGHSQARTSFCFVTVTELLPDVAGQHFSM